MLVAIVGRPNVGKSTLFNLLVRENRAIVGPERGITRDRIYGRWQIDEEHVVDVVDTGGYDSLAGGPIGLSIRDQTLQAVQEADVILCLLDARTGITKDDVELVQILRESNVDVIHVANKVDDPHDTVGTAQLYELGIDGFFEISAINKCLGGLAQAIRQRIEHAPALPQEGQDAIRVSIIGRPNVGKSLLFNRIIGEDRAIVSPEPCTTRDYVDIRISRNERDYVFVDTAGIRRRAHIDDKLEKLSVMRSIQNVERSHVCLCIVDATEPFTDQDRHLLGIIMDHGRASAIVINKSDLIDSAAKKAIWDKLDQSLRFAHDITLLFTSALTGKYVHKLFPLIEELYSKTTAQAPTSLLNRVLHDITDKTHHPTVKGRRIKFYYITQVGTVPPRFRIVSNHPDLVTAAYSRFLAGSIKKSFGMDGIPVKLSFVGR